jgi:hypothetical protein
MELELKISKKRVVLKDFITKGDSDWAQEIMLKAIEFNNLEKDFKTPDIKNFDPKDILEFDLRQSVV